LPTTTRRLSSAFEEEGDGMPTERTLGLYIDKEKDGEQTIKTQPGNFSLAGERLNVGRDGAEPVTDDYPGESPCAFVGGTIHKVADVAGKPWVDPRRRSSQRSHTTDRHPRGRRTEAIVRRPPLARSGAEP
jgi:hypothetical protein